MSEITIAIVIRYEHHENLRSTDTVPYFTSAEYKNQLLPGSSVITTCIMIHHQNHKNLRSITWERRLEKRRITLKRTLYYYYLEKMFIRRAKLRNYFTAGKFWGTVNRSLTGVNT